MTQDERGVSPLSIKDCTFTALATGEEARNLRELWDRLKRVPASSLYYHFWGRLLRPAFEDREYINDFANWVGYSLQDPTLAERMALVDPVDYPEPEDLRERLLELIEERIQESWQGSVAQPGSVFHFLRGKIVVFSTGRQAGHPGELARVMPTLTESSVFYHLIDGRYRSGEGTDDFQAWLRQWGTEYQPLLRDLSLIDIYHTSLEGLRNELTHVFRTHSSSEAA